MDDKTAIEEVIRIGQKIEADADRAEAESYFRSWRPAPNGGHDPDFVRTLQCPDVAR